MTCFAALRATIFAGAIMSMFAMQALTRPLAAV